MKVLLSIKPEFVEEIIAGRKKFEYRKKLFKQSVDSVVIYASKPMGLIIGEFTIDTILVETPHDLWTKTKRYSGITKQFFSKYFNGKERGYAIKIKKFFQYTDPINPFDMIEDFVAPQSFRYVSEEIGECLQNCAFCDDSAYTSEDVTGVQTMLSHRFNRAFSG
ncbi:ASCH domain-containing protein [Ethanoligenens harbinense]|uniref:ASCH domain-containing protein n=1 Tax=Ethanoligenens harbinense (strain DSM 18485 / JCM 12961 / CGMCC 1.5033 / YUAN-3) TaxID=663278 RepID=E6U5U4_ETHHY|nr:ASCH domain-containing protein [Ethanoligenens harbinense]ADU27961.1 protein of unknown function DUF437 [Ethanoligenens harbinense YUAN-3]QCN93231.1 ASCH domain-containing protein [Ethanoligenens harbinense]